MHDLESIELVVKIVAGIVVSVVALLGVPFIVFNTAARFVEFLESLFEFVQKLIELLTKK